MVFLLLVGCYCIVVVVLGWFLSMCFLLFLIFFHCCFFFLFSSRSSKILLHPSSFLQGLGLSPCALSQDFVQVQGHGLAGDQTLDLLLQLVGKDPHQGLGSKPVLGPLLVVAWKTKTVLRTRVRSIVQQYIFTRYLVACPWTSCDRWGKYHE